MNVSILMRALTAFNKHCQTAHRYLVTPSFSLGHHLQAAWFLAQDGESGLQGRPDVSVQHPQEKKSGQLLYSKRPVDPPI